MQRIKTTLGTELICILTLLASTISCSRTEIQLESRNNYSVSLITQEGDTRTGIEQSGDNYTALWGFGDQMEIYLETVSASTRDSLTNQASGAVATFTGSVTTQPGTKTVYGFYPSAARAAGTEDGSHTVSVDVPYIQSPARTSFDPLSDILAAEPMQVTFGQESTTTITNVRFARQLAIIKIVPVDATTDGLLSEDKILLLKMSALDGTTLTGRAKLDLEQSKITDWTSQSARNHVTGKYKAGDNFSINGSDASYLMVAPGTLAQGSTIKFEVSTDAHLLTKEVTLPLDIDLPVGVVTTLTVKFTDGCVQSNGAALPLTEDFSSASLGNNTAADGSSTLWGGNDNIPHVIKIYQAGKAIRMGTGSSSGSIATKMLDLSGNFTVSFKVKGWSNVEGNLTVTAGSQSKTVEYTARMSDAFESVSIPFYGESSLCNVIISTTAKRCFIDDLSITAGKDLEHKIVAVDQIALPFTSGVGVSFTVSSDYDWTSTSSSEALFTYDPSAATAGIKTVTVTSTSENKGYSSRVCGTITISDGTVAKVVTVYQNGSPDPSATGWAELPALTTGENLELCKHSTLPSNSALRNYSFLFDKNRHCSLWVAWPLHSCYIGNASRQNSFDYDPIYIVNDFEANLSGGAYYPYYGSSYSHARGHQMPSAERTRSEQDNITTFFATNMTPQLQGFNGGVWEELESLERTSYICSDTLYIVSGPYFDPNVSATYAYDSKGKGKACQVPTHYWKIFLRTKAGNSGKKVSECSAAELQCVGFWFTHESRSGKPTASDMKSVKQIEDLTGFTFFPNVPNAPKTTYSSSDWGL